MDKVGNKEIMAECPICGRKAYVYHSVVDGFDLGWDAGCARFRLNDGIHGIDEYSEDKTLWPCVSLCNSKDEAIRRWNEKAAYIKDVLLTRKESKAP